MVSAKETLREARCALQQAKDLSASATILVAFAEAALRHASAELASAKPDSDLAMIPPATDHRREHRYGPVPRIDRDPELEAFIRARLGSMTYVDLARAANEEFGPERGVSKSAIWSWHQRQINEQQNRTG